MKTLFIFMLCATQGFSQYHSDGTYIECILASEYAHATDCTSPIDHPELFVLANNYQSWPSPGHPSVLKAAGSTYYVMFGALDIHSALSIPPVSGLPSGVGISFTRDNSFYTSAPNEPFWAFMNVTASSAAVPGHYSITVNSAISANGTHGYGVLEDLLVTSSTASIAPSNQAVNGGSSLAYTVTFSGPGVASAIAPACYLQDRNGNAPSGMSLALSLSSVAAGGGTTTATVSTASGTAAGDYTLVCNGSGTGVYLVDATASVHVN